MGSQFSAKRRTRHQISPPHSSTASPPSPGRHEISIPIDRRSEGLLMAKNRNWGRKKQPNSSRRQVKTIDILPDDALLEIFDFYVDMSQVLLSGGKREIEGWQSLVHVCRRWRSLVFESPRRLNLRLVCKPETPAKNTLDVWPALPIIIRGYMPEAVWPLSSGVDNIIVALGQRSRVRDLDLSSLAGWQLGRILDVMQVPFPEMSIIQLSSHVETLSAVPVPDSFLGGSAPRLHSFSLSGIPFPGLPKLLLSAARRLYSLRLTNIPDSGYISPEAIVALISVLSNLRILSLEFETPQSRPDPETRRPPPSKRSVVPALSSFHFKGVVEYLEDLVTHIDTPQLDEMHITFFDQIDFDCPQLAQFIYRTPKLRACGEAHVQFDDRTASARLRSRTPNSRFGDLLINISCGEPDWQLWSIEQVCNSSVHPLSTVVDLYIVYRYWHVVWRNYSIESTEWLQFLLPFTAVKNLYLSKEFAPGIVAALQELLVGGRITGVLPSLQNIFAERLESSGPLRENIGQLVAARQLSESGPIAISGWDKVSYLKSI